MDFGTERSINALRERSAAVLDAALQGGVRYIDAARSYGLAETFLADWLRGNELAPGAVAIGSKWGYTYVGDWRLDAEKHEIHDLSANALQRQLAETLNILGEHLTLYQIHSARPESGVLEDRTVLDGLADLRASGIAVGLTVSGPRQAEMIDAAITAGTFDAVQATWNVLEPSSGDALARAHAAGILVIVKEALANGRLTHQGSQQSYLDAARKLKVAPEILAIGAALANPWADVVLSGAVTVEQLRAGLQAEQLVWSDDHHSCVHPLRVSPRSYWDQRVRLPWT